MSETKRGSLARAWDSPEFWNEVAISEFASGLRRVMGSMKQRELAQRLGVSESAVSQVLSGAEGNYSIERMNRIAAALDAAVHVCVAKRDSLVRWDITPTGPLGEILPGAQEASAWTAGGPRAYYATGGVQYHVTGAP